MVDKNLIAKGNTSPKIAETSPIETPEIVLIDIPKKGEQAEGEKAKRTYKKREPKAPTGSKKTGIGAGEISALIVGVFSLVGMKAGEHWNLTVEEADSVSKPLSNILDKLNLTEQVASVSDGAMLVLALAMITIPRVMITASFAKSKQATKEEKIKSELGVKTIEKDKGNINQLHTGNAKSNDKRATDDISSSKAFYQSNPQ